jgi:hypothetical protein
MVSSLTIGRCNVASCQNQQKSNKGDTALVLVSTRSLPGVGHEIRHLDNLSRGYLGLLRTR